MEEGGRDHVNQPAADASCWVVIGCPRNLNEDVRSANAASVATALSAASAAVESN